MRKTIYKHIIAIKCVWNDINKIEMMSIWHIFAFFAQYVKNEQKAAEKALFGSFFFFRVLIGLTPELA